MRTAYEHALQPIAEYLAHLDDYLYFGSQPFNVSHADLMTLGKADWAAENYWLDMMFPTHYAGIRYSRKIIFDAAVEGTILYLLVFLPIPLPLKHPSVMLHPHAWSMVNVSPGQQPNVYEIQQRMVVDMLLSQFLEPNSTPVFQKLPNMFSQRYPLEVKLL